MINKEQDWVINLLGNPQASPADLKNAGLSTENTQLLSATEYIQRQDIKNNELFHNDEGVFDENKFKKFYENAKLTYNMLANDSFMDRLSKEQTIYGKDDILAPRDRRRKFSDVVMEYRLPNPDKRTTGLIRLGETEKPKWSISENAQTNKVLANPTEVYDENGEADWSKAIWHDSPNDSPFTDFWDTRVLAQYEQDGEHTDPFTGNKVKHKKGEIRLDSNGDYFYENLDGRDIYGKLVLNKMNTFTVDGSRWNDYDFFDSDDLEQKGIISTSMKNLALVGTMFIPYVGPWIAGASTLVQLAGLSATLGKMFLGSDSPTLSAIEGWTKSVNRQTAKSQYAQENIWCWENFVNLIGDVAGLLKELRFLFDYAPAIFKGNRALAFDGISEAKQQLWVLKRAEEYRQHFQSTLDKLSKAGKLTRGADSAGRAALQSVNVMASKDMEKFILAYQHLGSILSKGYMTAVTVGDTFGEAKYEAGASDTEAMWLTLGYAAAEAALLNSPIGEWILPELKASGAHRRKVLETLFANVPSEMRMKAVKQTSEEAAKKSAKFWFNKGKEWYDKAAALGGGLGGLMLSGGLSEGVEEVSEELLADFSRACFNYYQTRTDQEGRMSAWENMQDRYLMAFLGGGIGGGLTAAGTNFRNASASMTSERAIQELVYAFRNGERAKYENTLNKMTVAHPHLKNISEEIKEGTAIVFEEAKKYEESMDSDLKRIVRMLFQHIDDIIKTEGLKIPDNEFIDSQTFNDIRLAKLQTSPVASLFLLDFNSLCADIISVKNAINGILNGKADSQKLTQLDEERVGNLTATLNELRVKKESYLKGEYAMDYVSKALMDLVPVLSQYYVTPTFKDYVASRTHIPFERINQEDLDKYKEEYDNWNATERKNVISSFAPVYLAMARNFRDFMLNFSLVYDEQRKNKTLQLLLLERQLSQVVTDQYSDVNLEDPNKSFLLNTNVIPEQEWVALLEDTYNSLENSALLTLVTKLNDKKNIKRLELISKRTAALIQKEGNEKELENLNAEYTTILYGDIVKNLDKHFDQFINAGTVNPEIKQSLINILKNSLKWLNNISSLLKLINGSKKAIVTASNLGIDIKDNISIEDLINTVDIFDASEILGMMDVEQSMSELNKLTNLLGLPKVQTLKDIDNLKDLLNILGSLVSGKVDQLQKATYSDIITFTQNFINTNSDSKLDIFKLLENINGLFYQNSLDLSGVSLIGLLEQINEAIEVIGWTQGMLIGAQSDQEASLQDLTGYNRTLNLVARANRVKDWEDLPEINQETVNILNQDLEIVKSKLIAAKNLFLVNQGKRLNLQNRVDANKNFITYSRLKKWVVNIGDEWKEKEKLQQAINDADLLSKYSETRNQNTLTQKDREAIKKEMFKIEDAIYDFFNNEENLKQIESGNLYKLFEKGLDLFHGTDQLIDDLTEYLADRNLFWLLATRASIKRSLFNNEFRQVINKEIAPIPTLEEAIFHNIAHILNGDMGRLFVNAFRKAAILKFDGLSDEDKADIAEELKFDVGEGIANADVLPLYSDIQFTEGIAGAGKTSILQYTIQILNTFHKDVLQNVWVAHSDNTRALKFAKELGLENSKIFSKEALMKALFSNYNTKRTINSNGEYEYATDEWVRDADNNIVYNQLADDLSEDNRPTLIIIDELSHYDLADLSIILDSALKHGFAVISTGDFGLSSISSRSENWEGKGLTITPTRNLHKHNPKIGISMRSNNILMDKSINSFHGWLKEPDPNKRNKQRFVSYYYEGEEGLNGVKGFQSYSGEDKKLIDDTIELMLSTTKEKIGLIYQSEETPLVKELLAKYPDRFEKFKGTAAQGLEGQYYIVDFTGIGKDVESQILDFYTGMTRAMQGALIIKGNNTVKIDSVKEEVTGVVSYDPNEIARYSEHYKAFLDTNYSLDLTIPYKPRTPKNELKLKEKEKEDPEVPVVGPVPAKELSRDIPWTNPNKVLKITYKGDQYITDGSKVGKIGEDNKVELLAEDDPTALKIISIIKHLEENGTVLSSTETNEGERKKQNVALNNKRHETPVEQLIEEASGLLLKFTYLFHSHNTFELGVANTSDGSIKFLDLYRRYSARIDSVIGLLKIFEGDTDKVWEWLKPTRKLDFYKEKLEKIRGFLFNIEGKLEMTAHLSNLFTEVGRKVTSIEFGLLSSPNISDSSTSNWGYSSPSTTYGILDKNKHERTIQNSNTLAKDANKINRKSINAVITLDNGQRLAVPLFVLGNLETYTRNPQGEISSRLLKLLTDNGGEAGYDFHMAILDDPVLSKIPQIANLAKLFIFTDGAYFKIHDDSWTPAKNLRNWGILVNVDAVSGKTIPYNGKEEFRPIKDIIEELGYHASKQIYTAQQPFNDGKGNLIDLANIGHPYILVTKDPRIITDKLLEDLYQKQLIDPTASKKVTLVYLLPPKATTKEYLENLYTIIKAKGENKKINIKQLGSELTSYYIWNSLLDQLKAGNPIFDRLSDSTKLRIIEEVEELNSYDTTSDKLSALLLTSDWTGIATSRSKLRLYEHLNYALLNMFMDFSDSSIIPEHLEEFAKFIEDSGTPHVFYTVHFKNKKPDRIPISSVLESDLDADSNSLYTLNGLPFTINAKLDSYMFSGGREFDDIIASFVDLIIPAKDGVHETSKDTDSFVNPIKVQRKVNSTTHILEPNSLGVDKIVINYDNKTVNNNPSTLNVAQLRNYTIKNKATILQEIKRIIDFLPNYDSIVDLLYDALLRGLLEGDLNIYDAEIEDIISTEMAKINSEKSNKLVFWGNKRAILKEFSKEDLDKFGIEGIEVTNAFTALKYNTSGIAEESIGNGITAKFNKNDDTVELTKENVATQSTELKEDTMQYVSIEAGSDFINLLLNLDPTGKLRTEFGKMRDQFKKTTLGECIGNKRIVRLLTTAYDSNNNLELKTVIDYLNGSKVDDTVKYCTVSVKR